MLRLIVLFLALPVVGCTGWRRTTLTPDQLLSPREAKVGRLMVETHAAAPLVVLQQPALVGDSIVGFAASDSLGSRRVAISTSEVRQLRVRRLNWLATAGLVVLGASVVAASQIQGIDVNPRLP